MIFHAPMQKKPLSKKKNSKNRKKYFESTLWSNVKCKIDKVTKKLSFWKVTPHFCVRAKNSHENPTYSTYHYIHTDKKKKTMKTICAYIINIKLVSNMDFTFQQVNF